MVVGSELQNDTVNCDWLVFWSVFYGVRLPGHQVGPITVFREQWVPTDKVLDTPFAFTVRKYTFGTPNMHGGRHGANNRHTLLGITRMLKDYDPNSIIRRDHST